MYNDVQETKIVITYYKSFYRQNNQSNSHHTILYSALTNTEKGTIWVNKSKIERHIGVSLSMSTFPAHCCSFLRGTTLSIWNNMSNI